MRDPGTLRRAAERIPEPLRGRAALWVGFLAVHVLVVGLALTAPNAPLGDVSWTYVRWVADGLEGRGWVGVDEPWVYPYPALLPMIAAAIAGLGTYTATWLALVVVLDAVALAALTGVRSARGIAAGWWWIAFTGLLGPIAVGRLDAVSVAIAIPAVVVAATRPRLAGALLALGAWIKIWPAAIGLALVIAIRARRAVLTGALAVTLAVVLVGLVLGGATSLSFLAVQGERGIQVESVAATAWMIAASAGLGGSVYYDLGLLTFQLDALGVELVSPLLTPLLVLAVAGVAALGVRAAVRGADARRVLPDLSLALVLVLIVANKVGSPQIMAWIAVPILLGLATPREHRGPLALTGGLALAVAALTQVLYPVWYDRLLGLEPLLVASLAARTLALLALLGIAMTRLGRLGAARGRSTS